MGTVPGGQFSQVDRRILALAMGARLARGELQRLREHVVQAGFDPSAAERVRGRLAGVSWRGRVLSGTDRLPPAEAKYLWHVLVREEWPRGTGLSDYIASIREVILDPLSGVFTNRYQGAWGFGIVRQSGELSGPRGFEWVLVQYRLGWGHWTTAFQPELGLQELDEPCWSDIRWLRRPIRGSVP